MRLVHRPEADRDREVLATRVEIADSRLERMRGLMFRRSLPEGFALVFPFERPASRSVHMLFVRVPLDVLWLRAGRVERVARLRPWRGIGIATADTIVELPAGAATDVSSGDPVRLETD